MADARRPFAPHRLKGRWAAQIKRRGLPAEFNILPDMTVEQVPVGAAQQENPKELYTQEAEGCPLIQKHPDRHVIDIGQRRKIDGLF